MWQLVINGPGYFDTTYDLPEGTTHVGRADENDVVLSGDLVSRKHARFHVRADALTLEDLGSRNGTRLNGKAVTGSHDLSPGDTVAVGENALEVRRPTSAEAADTEMIDAGAGGVKRFGRGVDIAEAVVMAKSVKDSGLLRALDNILPFETSATPPTKGKPRAPASTDTDEDDVNTNELPLDAVSDQPNGASPVAWQSLVLLYRVAEKLATAPSLQAFLDETTDLVMTRVGATTGVVLLRHASGIFVPAAVRHASKLRKGEVPVSDAVVEAALSQGQAIAVADVRDDKRFAERESVVLYGIDQVLCIPIGAGPPWLGVLYLNRASGKEKVEGLLDICTAITQLLQTGIQKHQPRPVQDERLRRTLERFYSPDVVERRLPELLAHGKLSWLEERQVTVLVADVADLLAAKLPLDRLAEVLGEFSRLTAQLCFSFEGAVVGVTGAAVTALFGAPFSKGDDAIRAVRASIALKAEWEDAIEKRPPKERVGVRVGLHTGKVLTGTVGTDARLDVPALGEPMHLTHLLCASASPGQLLITGKTLAAVGARFDVTPLGERPLEGSRTRTAVFEVIDEDSDSGTLSGIR